MFSRYFQEELAYLRDLGREFGEAYPELGGALATPGTDPAIERLLSGVAFLTGRIREKLDDELPEAIHGITSLLFPQMQRSMPSACIMELAPHLEALREGLRVPKGTEFASVPVDGTQCRFRSTYDVILFPWEIEDVHVESLPGGRQQIRLEMRITGGRAGFGALVGRDVRFHLGGERRAALELLNHLAKNLEEVAVVQPHPQGGRPTEISLGRPFTLVGFEEEDALLPVDVRLFPGYRLLQEYFTLPEKFSFVDVGELAHGLTGGEKADRYDICFRCKGNFPSPSAINTESIKIHCTPALNVFEASADPIHLSAKQTRFRLRVAGIRPDHAEVYSVRDVTYLSTRAGERRIIPNFYDFAYAGKRETAVPIFHNVHLKPSVVGEGTDAYLSFGTPIDADVMPDAETVSVNVIATNGHIATMLRPGDVRMPTPSSPAIARFRNLSSTTPHVPAPIGRELAWRMVAQASMGLRSLADIDVLKALLETHNFQALVNRQAARSNELRVNALRELAVTPVERLYRGTPVRGVAIELTVDEDGFAGDGDIFLFSAILERLFGDYVSLNSFSRVTVSGHATGVRFPWPPRNGSLLLL